MIFHKNIVVCEAGTCQGNGAFSWGSLLLFHLAPPIVAIRRAGDVEALVGKILFGKFCKASIACCTPILSCTATADREFNLVAYDNR